MFDLTVEIGKTDPPHVGHYDGSESYYFLAEKHLRLVGSAGFAPNLRVALSYEQRRLLLDTGTRLRRYPDVQILPLRDYGDDMRWREEVCRIVYSIAPDAAKVLLIGASKDESSYYLKLFPEWTFFEAPLRRNKGRVINASDLRLAWLDETLSNEGELLDEWAYQYLSSLYGSEQHRRLREELEHLRSFPLPSLIHAYDGVVVCHDHLLLARRSSPIGRGLLALPSISFVDKQRGFSDLIHHIEGLVKVDAAALIAASDDTSVEMKSWRFYGSKSIVTGIPLHLPFEYLPEILGEGVEWVPLQEIPAIFSQVWADQMLLTEKVLGRTFR